MSMNADPDDFDQLCRLLKLKQHESPPPRYFNEFSGQVISRIQAATPGGRFESLEEFLSQSPWVRQFWRVIEQRPAFSGICTAALCGLLVVGVFLSDSGTQPLMVTVDGMAKEAAPSMDQPGQNRLAVTGPTPSAGLFENSTNPAIHLRSEPSLFGELQRLGGHQPQRVNGLPIPVGSR